MTEDKRDRNRFTAIVEEMVEGVSAIQKKQAQYPAAPQFTVPRIFEPSIKVVDGVPEPCPKCNLQAFTKVMSNLWCRAMCVEGTADPYVIEECDATPLKLQKYKCGRCGRQDMVTMSLPEVNLQCWSCKQLTIHTLHVAPLMPLLRRAFSPYDYIFGKDDDLTEAKAASSSSKSFEALVDDARIKLGLVPFVEFTNGALARNYKLVEAGVMTMLDISRRTGRTTQGLIEAIVRASRTSIGALFMVSRTSMHEATLQRDAFEMCGRLGLSLTVSTWRGGLISDQVVYVDHSYDDQLKDRFATLRFKP